MKITRARSVMASCILLGSTASGVALASPASASTLHNINVQAYCSSFKMNAVVVYPYNAYSWRCYSPVGSGNWIGVDMQYECWVESNWAGKAVVLSPSNPYSWRCLY